MRDVLAWSLPLGRLFGVTVRVHWLFPIVVLGLLFHAGFKKDVAPGTWTDAAMVLGLLFVSVFLHEFGHVFGARSVDGDASDVLLWPLGGLAFCDVPHTPRANFITAAAGPAVNLLLCLGSGLVFVLASEYRPTWNPIWYPYRTNIEGVTHLAKMVTWSGQEVGVSALGWVMLARFFWVNWILCLLNVVLIGFPLDGGRMLQCALWPRMGYRQATLVAVYAGFVVMFILIIVSIAAEEVLALMLAIFIFLACKQQWIVLETGGEDSMMGYDFSQGYTSLEREQAPPPRRRQSWWQRWQQRRAQRRMQRETEQRQAEESRMDQLLEKVQQEGLSALSEEERRFLKRVSDKYRNRH